ncbi:MAG: UDP-N-acetylglucosamine--N-acetylmuramyl-(pentapeptide) pyrophosphoryl-undecaprenol N-acetylglucosamine transferase [Pseudomonadota bacterium]
MKPLAIIAAGGTGGHMFPAQALAETLLNRGWRVKLSTDKRGARYASGFPAAVRRVVVPSATPARGGLLAKILLPFRLLGGTAMMLSSLWRDRPSVVVGFGGYPTVPAMGAAVLLRLPRMIHEQNGVLGRVNELFARRVHKVACGTWPTALPDGVEGFPAGNPVRAAIAAKAGVPYAAPGEEGPLNLLVFGGSQGASIFARMVPQALAQVPPEMRARIQLAHQARDADRDELARVYAALEMDVELEAFFADMPARLVVAHLVICRSGASSVADLTAVGRPSILVPLAIAKRDEQSANAAPLVAAGGAFMIREDDLTGDVLARHITAILSDGEGAAAMASEAAKLGRPDAAQTLADLVETVAGQKA